MGSPAGAGTRLYAFLSRRWYATFVLMGAAFVAFGLLSLNLLHVLSANLEFLSSYGLDAVREGGLLQLVQIIAYGYLAAACYVFFKLCEKVLVERLAQRSKEIET